MSDEVVPEITAADVLLASEKVTKALREKQEGVIDVLSEPNQIKRFSNLRKSESIPLAKIQYAHKDRQTIGDWETEYVKWRERELADWKGAIGGKDVIQLLSENQPPAYSAPTLPPDLVDAFLDYRTSEQHLLINVLKSVAHVVEGSGGGKVGFFGRRKRL